MIKNSVKVVSMDSGNNHSQNIPVRAEYERQITPYYYFYLGAVRLQINGASKGPGL